MKSEDELRKTVEEFKVAMTETVENLQKMDDDPDADVKTAIIAAAMVHAAGIQMQLTQAVVGIRTAEMIERYVSAVERMDRTLLEIAGHVRRS